MMYGDYHTHTTYTHGKGSIEDNVKCAIAKGLKEIAISEHSFSHMAYGVKRKTIPIMRAEIEELQKKYPQIKILLGIESNIIGLDGKIDVYPEDRHMFDVVVVGYHKTFKATTWRDFWKFFVPNTFNFGWKQSAKRRQMNTEAYINAIKKNQIDIISHLNYGGCQTNCVEIAKVAKEYGTKIELNGKRINFTPKEIRDMVATGVMFVLSSDAHRPERVGRCHRGINVIEKYGIPYEQVANWNKIMERKRDRD